MREVFPTKYYRDAGFVEYKVEIKEEDLAEIIEEYLARHADFDFDEIELVNNRPMNVWLYAKCRKYTARRLGYYDWRARRTSQQFVGAWRPNPNKHWRSLVSI